MTDPSQSNNQFSSDDLAGEFRDLGNNLKNIFQKAWESAERRKLQQEIETGIDELGKSLNQAFNEIKDSPAGQQFKEDARDLHERVRSGEVETKVRSELLSILHQVNAELNKVVKPKPGTSEEPSNEE
jgi:predicted component of type VI protein secretion system